MKGNKPALPPAQRLTDKFTSRENYERGTTTDRNADASLNLKTPLLPTVRLAGCQVTSHLWWAGALSILLLACIGRSQPATTSALPSELPARYFRLLDAELALVEKRLDGT